MYKHKLFAHGAKYLLKHKSSLKSYKHHKTHKTTTGGSLHNLDNYLLSLVGGVRHMSMKHKKPAKRGRGCCGSGLKFIR